MNRVALILCLLSSTAICLADPPTTAPDKSQYTLFNPVPADQLRQMTTDRPNTTNTPQTVDPGHVQIETGILDYAYYRDRYHGADARFDVWQFGQFNFRVGVLSNIELNAVINSYELQNVHDFASGTTITARSFGDTIFGGKLNLWGNEISDDPWQSCFAIQPQFKFPTAQSDVGNGKFEFTVGGPFEMNLPDKFHLSLQPGISHERSVDNTGYVTGFQAAACIDRNITDKLDLFLEYASDTTNESHTKAVQTIDVGYIYQLTDNLALDTDVNFGLNDATPNVEVLAGFSVRF